MTPAAIILFAHGARDPEWAGPLRRVREAMLAVQPGRRVELAFLEMMAPTLPECVEAMAAEGVVEIVVVPMFIAPGGHLKRDLPELIESLRERFPGLCLRQAGAVGEAAAVQQAMAHYALSA